MSTEQDLEFVDLAADLMIPTEVKEVPAAKPEIDPAKEVKTSTSESSGVSDDGSNKVPLSEVISFDDSAEHLVNGIDSILGLAAGAFYAIKAHRILNAEERKLYEQARKKMPSERTNEETYIIDYYSAEKAKIEAKSEAADLTEKEIAKLKKTAKAFVKMKNIKVGAEIAFYVMLADIVSDRVIDAFID